jgi:hypothetical protein
MKSREIADYLREHYPRNEYIMLTLVSCSLVLRAYTERQEEVPPEIQIVTESLDNLRSSMTEEETLAVAMLMAEIDRLGSEEDDQA